MNDNTNDPIIEQRLTAFLDSHLRQDDNWPISPALAETIEVLASGKLACYVQWNDFDGSKLATPLLWRYRAWYESVEKYNQQKSYSENRRRLSYIFDHNVRMVARALYIQGMLSEERALPVAFAAVKNNNKNMMRLLQVELITKEEDLT